MNTITTAKKGWEQKNETEHYASRDFWLRLGNSNKFDCSHLVRKFWHRHESCKYAYTPKTNTKFWVDKITSNTERDKVNAEKLTALRWNVLTVWECEIRHTYKHDLTPLIDRIEIALLAQAPQKISMKIYEEIENEIMLVADDVVEYQRTPQNKV